MRNSVAVIGAGTSGLIAAKRIASLGIETAVYEQKTKLGYPQKASGIVSIKGLMSLGVGYRKAVTNTLYGANIHAGKTIMRVISKEPQAHVLDRVKLNEICYKESIEAGAEVRKGIQVDSNMLAKLHKGNIIVGADGALSTVARHFSMGELDRYLLTYKADFEVEVGNSKIVDMFFDNRIAPNFFAWLCPNSKEVLEVGIGIDSRYGNSKAAFELFLKTEEAARRIKGAKQIEGHASIIPLRTTRRLVDEKNEVVLVGDAAGQVKATTGGGIVFGGNGAIMASNAIAEHIQKGAPLKQYETSFKRKFGSDLALHLMINRIYSNISANRMAFMLSAMKTLGFEEFFAKHGDMDRPILMLKRLFLRRFAK